jgi:hypothetical protein
MQELYQARSFPDASFNWVQVVTAVCNVGGAYVFLAG